MFISHALHIVQVSSLFFTENHSDKQLWARAAHLLQCLCSAQPSNLHGMEKWVSALWLSNKNGDGWMFWLYFKFAAWPTSWRQPGADWLSLRGPKVNSRIWLCAVYDSTLNIVVVVLLLLWLLLLCESWHKGSWAIFPATVHWVGTVKQS